MARKLDFIAVLRSSLIFQSTFTNNMAMESYWHVDYISFVHFQLYSKMKAVEAKERNEKSYFCSRRTQKLINPKRTSHDFLPYLTRKKRIIQIGPPEVWAWGVGSSRIDSLMCPYRGIGVNHSSWTPASPWIRPNGGWGCPKLKIKINFDFPTIKKP